MKVLLINHFPLTGSGSGVYTYNLAKGLVNLGIEVGIVYPDNIESETNNTKIRLYPVMFKGENSTLFEIGYNFPCFTTHPRSTKNFKELSREEKIKYEALFLEKIKKAVDEFKPDIIHAQHIWTLAGLSALIANNYDIPLILTCHGTDLIGLEDELKQCQYWGSFHAKNAVKYADKIIAISNQNKEKTEKMFPNEKDKIVLIPNGVDNEVFYIQENIDKKEILKRYGIVKNFDKIVSFAGKFTEIKGVDVLLDAAKLYENEDVLTIVAGDGVLREKLTEYSKKLNLKNIVFIGNRNQNELSQIYNISDVLAMPSRSEAFGLVAAEAGMCGTPVVASNVGGLTDFVTPDVGFLFEVNNSKELAAKINCILNKNVIFDRKKISQKTSEKYSQNQVAIRIKNLYESILPKKMRL